MTKPSRFFIATAIAVTSLLVVALIAGTIYNQLALRQLRAAAGNRARQ